MQVGIKCQNMVIYQCENKQEKKYASNVDEVFAKSEKKGKLW